MATAEPGGIQAATLLETLSFLHENADIQALEIAEFTPRNDVEHKTEKLIFEIIEKFYIENA